MTKMPDMESDKAEASVAIPVAEARDFVYAGRRTGKASKVFGAVKQIIDGHLGPEEYYGVDTLKGKIVGGIYTGASFHEGGSRGISSATWLKRWSVADDLIMWRAHDDAVETELRAAKLMADSKRINEIDGILLPLRKLYASYAKQYNHASREALEQAVLRSLRSPPRKTELV